MKLRYYIGRLAVRLKGFKNQKSYSQINEDVVLDWLTGHKERGTYIDIGAYDPDHMSNTKLFYERGWHGINVEPDPKACARFSEKRPRDITLNEAVGEGEMDYFESGGDTGGNTFTSDLAMSRGFTKSRKIRLKPLREIFSENNIMRVDFMTIDVEGFEDHVLRSNDWTKYKADVICLEGYSYDYLKQFGYKRVFWDGGNCYYKLQA